LGLRGWDYEAFETFTDAVADVAGDRDTNVVIFTGTGERFWDSYGEPDLPEGTAANIDMGAELWDQKAWEGIRRPLNWLDIQVPVIAAVNGPCNIHTELPVSCDIVLCSEDAYFQDSAHFPRGLVPGDGVNFIWPMVLGPNRARYFLLTGQKLSAQQALDWGVVSEILPKAQLLDRAYELARYLVMRPPLTLRLTRAAFVHEFKRQAADHLAYGAYMEIYALRNFYTFRGGSRPLDKPWNQDPWADALKEESV
jgi:enoyl-CoA hydratase/carnithine racemase